MSSPKPMVKGSAAGRTDVEMEQFTYEWLITGFEHLRRKNGEAVWSPTFSTTTTEANWQLSLYPHGRREEDADYMSVYLHLHSCDLEPIDITVNFKICIGALDHFYPASYTYMKPWGAGSPKFVERAKLLELCDSDATFTISCEMLIAGKAITEAIDPSVRVTRAFNSSKGRWSQAFSGLLKEPKLSDVALLVEGEKFQAHKAILAAHSPVFQAMFENKDTRENITNEVQIEDMEVEVVEAMVEFFYTGEVGNLEELAHELLKAAEKYDVQSLKGLCEETLAKGLDMDNAAELLVHSDVYSCHELKEHIMQFMADNLDEVMETESYQEMKGKEPALVVELVDLIATRRKVNK